MEYMKENLLELAGLGEDPQDHLVQILLSALCEM